jgi:spore maturation protein SpmA
MLNRIWAAFFLLALLAAVWRHGVGGDPGVWAAMVASVFEMSKTAFEIALGLTGVMCLWLGLMKLGELGGLVDAVARGLKPLLVRLFPGVPAEHPAMGAMVMNLAANALGLDNAATPLGLKAMRELQALNPQPERATDAQILFLVLNTSGVTLLPMTILFYRAQLGAADPTDVFLPILIATFCSTMVGLLATTAVQRLRLFDPVLLAYLGGLTALVGVLVYSLSRLERTELERVSSFASNLTISAVILSCVLAAWWKRVPVYESFIEGAKEGFSVAVGIVPYLVAMLVAIGILRASGALDLLLGGVRTVISGFGWDSRFVDALPVALLRPLSGSGARGMMIEAMKTLGADSFAGRLACVFQGSTETTFYTLAVYFGAVGIRKERHALACGLIADFGGFLAAIGVAYLFFG